MIKYKKVYIEALGFIPGEFIPCELSGGPAVDIHHIDGRGDRIENLMALTRELHTKHGDIRKDKFMLLSRHFDYLISKKVEFDHKYLLGKIEYHKKTDSFEYQK